jgi:hypothetical protein
LGVIGLYKLFPRFRLEGTLGVEGGRDGIGRAAKDRADTIAHDLEHHPVVADDRLA